MNLHHKIARIARGRSYANVTATLALVVALGGTAYASATLAAHSVGTKQLKKGAVTSSKVKNFSLTYKDFRGGQLGLIEGYVHVKADGTVDEANSFGVTSKNVTLAGTNTGFCFSDLDFPVHGGVATVDSIDGSTNFTLGDPGGDCPGADNIQAEVLTRNTDHIGVRAGVFVVFY